MSTSINLTHSMWLIFIFLFCLLQILAAAILLRERGAATWLMLVASILSGIFSLSSRFFFGLHAAGLLSAPFETVALYSSSFAAAAVFSEILFVIGLILYALRRRALTTRIAELEQIIAAQNSRLQ